jgi:transcriptional regulator with XRE-family HTH domain
VADDPWQRQVEAFGEYVRAQRKLAKLTLRELAARAEIRLLSQIRRGLRLGARARVLAEAFEVSAETILEQAACSRTSRTTTGRTPRPRRRSGRIPG